MATCWTCFMPVPRCKSHTYLMGRWSVEAGLNMAQTAQMWSLPGDVPTAPPAPPVRAPAPLPVLALHTPAPAAPVAATEVAPTPRVPAVTDALLTDALASLKSDIASLKSDVKSELQQELRSASGKIQDEFLASQSSFRAYVNGIKEDQAALAKIVTQQGDNSALYRGQLGRAGTTADAPHPTEVVAAMTAGGAPPTVSLQPVAPPAGQARAPNNRRARFNPDGTPRLRLMDKDAVKWDEIPPFCKTHLQSLGITGPDDWERLGKEVCSFCGRTDHLLNRCFKIFSTTEKGKKFMETSRRVRSSPQLVGLDLATLCVNDHGWHGHGCIAMACDLLDIADGYEDQFALHLEAEACDAFWQERQPASQK